MSTHAIAIEFDDVVAGYGEFMILNNLSFAAQSGKITLLLGPNGAGKSTVLKTLFGLLKVRQGRVKLFGQDITGASAKELLTQHGVAFVPQGRNLFGQLSVIENLELGGITLGTRTTHERIPEILSLFPRIKERPVVRDGAIVIGKVMLLSLSMDHRLVDGHEGAAFAYEVIRFLEEPGLFMLEG